MQDRALVFTFSREAQCLRVSFYERDGIEKTLRPYELQDVDWHQVEKACLEISSLLGRSHRVGKVSPEILERLKRSGHFLFDLLIPSKAKEKLAGSKAQSLTLDLDDSLVHMPWELLYDGGEFLCRRFSIGRKTSTRQTPTSSSSRSLRAPFKVLILADPRGDLKDAYREGLEIKAFLDERRDVFQVDFQSHPVDISFVKKILRDYDVVHYAGHAIYRPENPSESGWVLSDGTLTAREISAMGGLRPMPALVFANGCQSGHSANPKIHEDYGQQIFGLANAYLLSGVQHYIGTLWDVLDAPSCDFAKSFYGFLAQGDSVGEAMRQARQVLGEVYAEESIVWASYVLYGDPALAFSSAPTESPLQSALPRAKLSGTDWRPVTRGEVLALDSGIKRKKSTWRYASLTLVVTFLLLGVLGYGRFYPFASSLEPTNRVELVSDALLPVTEALGSVGPGETALAESGKPTSNAAVPLTLSMNIIGQRKEADGSYTEVVVSEGSILRSYDNFQVHLETNHPAHVYVLIYDSDGKASQLFPDPKIDQPGFVQAGRRIAVPGQDLWFWLDENPGTETIYVLASEKSMADIHRLLVKMEKANEAERKQLSGEIQQRINIVQRGVGGIGKGQTVTYPLSDGRRIHKVTEVVSGSGAVVRAASFHHQ